MIFAEGDDPRVLRAAVAGRGDPVRHGFLEIAWWQHPEPALEDLVTAFADRSTWHWQQMIEVPAVATEDEVRALKPDYGVLDRVPYRGVIVTARADAGKPYDFVSRFFAPCCGVPEDPVTGSAHCALGPYWQARLGKDDLVGYQASPRGGTVKVGCRGERVRLAGSAVTVVRGDLLLPH